MAVASPASALAYSQWLLAKERGWSAPAAEVAGQGPSPAVEALPAEPPPTGPQAAPGQRPRGGAPAVLYVEHTTHRRVADDAPRLAASRYPDARAAEDRDAILDAVLALVRADGPGDRLAPGVMAALAPELAEVAAQVRIHDSSGAHEAARLLGAAAFTIGADVYFAVGELAPETDDGARLLRHELTHVQQYLRGGARGEHLPEVTSADEREAKAAEHRPTPRRDRWDERDGPSAAVDREGPRGVDAREPPRATDPARASVRAILRAAGLDVPPAQLEHLAATYRCGLGLSWPHLRGAGGAAYLAPIVDHARWHELEPPGTAPAAQAPREPLDDETRRLVRRATGIELPDVAVEVDAVLSAAGRLAEAVGPIIRLGREVPGPEHPLGRKVRLHEAMHVAQQQVREEQGPTDRTAVVEAEAHAAADAAERGAPAVLTARAEAGEAYGLGASDLAQSAAEAAGVDPMAWLRQHVPALGQLLSGGLEPMLRPIGQAAAATLRPLLDGIGFDQLGNVVREAMAPLGGGRLVFGVLTGCCECFGEALQRLLSAFQGMLASDGAQGVRSWLERIQTDAINGALDLLADVFAALQRWGQPVLAVIDAVSRGIDAARALLGAVADRVWRELICPPLGLDPSLPPREALRRKLEELWQPVQQVIDQARRALEQLWQRIRQNPVVAKLLRLYDDVRRLMRAIQLCRESQSRDPQRWLAILSQETRGTVFQELIDGLQHGYDSVLQARDAAVNWVLAILDDLGVLGAWNSAVPWLTALGQMLQSFMAQARAAVQAVRAEIERALTELSTALQRLWDAVRPYLSFAVGFAIAASALATGDPLPMIGFLAGQAFLALPDCHKERIATFVLDLFISFVEFFPARLQPLPMLKAAALSFLRTLRGAPAAQKIAAMDNLARIISLDVEVVAGFLVGVVEGLWASAVGFLTRVFLFPFTIGLRALWSLGEAALELGGRSFASTVDALDWLGEALSGAQPLPEPGTFVGGPLGGGDPATGGNAEQTRVDVRAIGRDEDARAGVPAGAGPDEAPPSGGNAGEDLSTGFEAPPAFPELPDPTALLERVFRRGVTRQEIEELLTRFGTGLDAAGARAGEQAAGRLIELLAARATPYRVGEVLGEVVGFVAGEIIVIVATLGIGAAATEAARGGVALAQIGMRFPRLIEALGAMRNALRPLLELVGQLGDDFARLLRQVMTWLEQLARWAERQLVRLLQWIARNPRTAWRWFRLLRRLWGALADDDEEELRAVAEEAAGEAWDYLVANMPAEVKDEPAVRVLLAAVHLARGGGIDVALQVRHTSAEGWGVRATASANGDAVSADFGEGWITRADPSEARSDEPFYATRNRGAEHVSLVERVIRTVTDWVPDGDYEDAHGVYLAKRSYAERQATQATAELALRGVRFLINMEEWGEVEHDLDIGAHFIITPNATHRFAHIPVGQTVWQGARKGPPGEFYGVFGEGGWTWAGFPSGSATRHPANDFLGYSNCAYLGNIRPANGTDYAYVGGGDDGTPGGSASLLRRWRRNLNDELADAREDVEDVHPEYDEHELDAAAVAKVESDYAAAGFPGLSWQDLNLEGPARWQAHHMHEHSWSGSDEPENFQYLRLSEHSRYTTWWNARRDEIKHALGI